MGQDLIYYVLSALASLIVLTVHEFSHAYAADKLGDPTAKNLGRLTLNPLKHLDIVGMLSMVFFHIGWAKPVPINARNLKKPKRDFALTALAGPLSNLICAFFAALLYLVAWRIYVTSTFTSAFVENLALYSVLFLLVFHQINLGIAVFNLIPVPPLDGSRILHLVLPPKLYFKVMRHDRTFYIALLLWLFLGDLLSTILLRIPFVQTSGVLSFIATYIVSLSNLVGVAIGWLSSLMISFWQLIPWLS
ncbi:MAG: site-2 protease family protein [Clostridia bacterium]|nr:site-2 protease family protein [Clostridia bacterium]